MSEKNNKYTPNLRFPEFTGEWEEKKLGEVFTFRNGYTPSKSEPSYWEKGKIPWFRMEDIRENGNVLYDSTQHITQGAIKGSGCFKANTIIVATSATIGEHALVKVEHLANQRFVNMEINNNYSNLVCIEYVYYYMFIIDEICKSIGNIGTFASVSTEELSKLSIFLPPTLEEQQKIASCLSTIDDLIAAQAEKVEALKEKKTGLMQQLFPHPGETTPRLRFPEFTGEWEVKKLGEVASSFSGGTPKSSESKYYGGDIPFIRSGEIHGCKTELYITEEGLNKSSAKLVSKGDLLIALYGATSGEVAISKIDGAINQAILCVRSQSINSNYLCNYLEYKKDTITSKFLQGGQGNLSSDIIMSLNIPSPSPAEQQKIASCLSALDDQIAAETEKLTAIKDYKKGLMQQLFPQPAK